MPLLLLRLLFYFRLANPSAQTAMKFQQSSIISIIHSCRYWLEKTDWAICRARVLHASHDTRNASPPRRSSVGPVLLKFTMSTTPLAHSSPSLPTSPLPKRLRIEDNPKSAMDPSNHTNGTSPAQGIPPPLSASPPLLVKKLSPHAKAPTRGSAFAAGYDLYSAKDVTIPMRGKELVDTDISIAVGEGCCQFSALHVGIP